MAGDLRCLDAHDILLTLIGDVLDDFGLFDKDGVTVWFVHALLVLPADVVVGVLSLKYHSAGQ